MSSVKLKTILCHNIDRSAALGPSTKLEKIQMPAKNNDIAIQ